MLRVKKIRNGFKETNIQLVCYCLLWVPILCVGKDSFPNHCTKKGIKTQIVLIMWLHSKGKRLFILIVYLKSCNKKLNATNFAICNVQSKNSFSRLSILGEAWSIQIPNFILLPFIKTQFLSLKGNGLFHNRNYLLVFS